jgi:hypothetical protein
MKTAVSIPDDLFKAAEALAKEKGLSRSQFYAKSLKAALNAEITAKLNEVYSGNEEVDEFWYTAQAHTLARTEPEVWEDAPKRTPKRKTPHTKKVVS